MASEINRYERQRKMTDALQDSLDKTFAATGGASVDAANIEAAMRAIVASLEAEKLFKDRDN